MPPDGLARLAFLSRQPFAHRGLHGGDIPENSRAAFAAAIEAGHGIECDVQPSRDGIPFVFHDDRLDRLTEEKGPVAARLARQLDTVRLANGEGIPRLAEMLALVDGQVPILVEVKSHGRRMAPFCRAVAGALTGYSGPLAVMSFDPEVGHWFARHWPAIVRGLVVSEEHKKGLRGGIERHASLWRSRADFLAYDVRDLPSRFATLQRRRGLPVLTWTVRDEPAGAAAAAFADASIYERV
ncbi:MAG TPA: glycerophosphodiester phosphodiesterase family protein [Sphingomonadaceae bacterium]|nr:glycerophosphodiester phosphodiesterase family protein [Sphingomonadaceae bacterium]